MNDARSIVFGLVLVGLAATSVAVSAVPALAAFSGGRVVRLEGFWDDGRRGPEILGYLVFSPDGRTRLTFAVTDVRAYLDADVGIQVFRASSLRPAINLRGREETIARFLEAGPDQTVRAFGVYGPGTADFIVGSVEVEARTPANDAEP